MQIKIEVKIEKKNTSIESNINNKQNELNDKKRSKSVVAKKRNNKIKNGNNEEKDDIDSILYEEIKPSKDEDPFDDVDSVVRIIDFDYVILKSKSIFSVKNNEKYEEYSQNFENIFNTMINSK